MSETKEVRKLSREERAIARHNAKIEKKLARRNVKIRESTGDRIMLAATTAILVLVLIIVAYPVIYVVSSSFSSNAALSAGRVVLFPVDPSLASYKFVFQYDVIWLGFRNTIFYTIVCTTVTILTQLFCAYPLARPNYQGRSFLMMFFFATRMFGAGMIPTLLLRTALGLRNNVFAVITLGVMSVSNMIIMRTCFRNTVPGELYDAAAIDGANDFQTLFKIATPLSKATLSVLTLYSCIGNWGEYFGSMIYLPERSDLWPLQLVIRPIMMASKSISTDGMTSSDLIAAVNDGTEGVTFSIIVITTVPVLLMYFVVQGYFEKGVMIGSVKG